MEKDTLFESLLDSYKHYIRYEEDLKMIKDAYLLAREKHQGQVRRSGEPYITHPVAVAKILASLGSGPQTLTAALLHDVVEDTDVTFEEVEKMFGKEIRDIVDGVTKIGQLSFNVEAEQSDNHQKMLLAMAKDIRVILIKIADRLHNIRTLSSMPEDKQERIARETLDIYAPLAHRLGIFRIKAELEDQSLKYTDPEKYYEVSRLIQMRRQEREQSIDKIIIDINSLFQDNHLESFEIKGRIKNIYSIYKKMFQNGRAFEDIYDLLAIRIIVDKIEECYQALGIIHANFVPIPRRFKDYIAVPKPNLYQSLHTTVLSEDGTLFEVQIRTKEMDQVAEIGVAAHWAYKEGRHYSKEKEQFEIAQKLKWYGEILKMSEEQENLNVDSKEFVDSIKDDILTANVYVFTPKGEVIELPTGATPVDFAYRIHTEVGHKMTAAIVNGKIRPIDTELKTGDIVSVKTNKNSVGPNESWLKFAKSGNARHKIRGFLNKLNKDTLVAQGKIALERELTANRLLLSDINDAFAKKHFEKQSIDTVEQIYHEIGKGTLSPKTVCNKLSGEVSKEVYLQRQLERSTRQLESLSETGIVVEGLTNPQIKLSNCCFPIPGDEVVGYVSKTQGIVVHCKECPNAKGLMQTRLIDVYFAEGLNRKYPVLLSIIARNTPNIINDVVTTINILGVNIAEINTMHTAKLEVIFKLKVILANKDQLNTVLLNLKQIPDVYKVGRDFRWEY